MTDTTFASRRVSIGNVRLAGCQAVVPQHVVTMQELEAQAPDAQVRAELVRAAQMSGLDLRHRARPTTTAGDMGGAAAQILLERLGWTPESVDILLLAGVTPDDLIPPTGYQVHAHLGLGKGCLVFDAIMGCAGYTHGLFLAASLLEQGKFRRALLLTGETLSRTAAPDDVKALALLGDAATATALEFTQGASAMHMVLGSDGVNARCIRQPGKGYRPSQEPPYFQMDGVKVFTFSHGVVPKLISATMELAGVTTGDIDYFCLHQANKMILDAIAKQGRLPGEKVINTLARFGNCGSASIPLALCGIRDEMPPRQPLRLLMAGFGLGLAWSSVILEAEAGVFGAVKSVDL